MNSSSFRICLFGAPPATQNFGVTALCDSVLAAVAQRTPSALLTVFDFGRGKREATKELNGAPFRYTLCGAVNSRRFYRLENLWNIRICAWLGGMGNPGARALRDADLVLDVSGGDSFTDLYGGYRLRSVVLPKLMALDRKVPLVLLPQTYGPFFSDKARRAAAYVLKRSTMAWARDEQSFGALRDILGNAFNPQRHRLGVDVAFGLERARPTEALPPPLESWLSTHTKPVVGVNISGLIHNNPQQMRQRYRFKADYRDVVKGFLSKLLRETPCNILLIPHVVTPHGHYESDVQACESAAKSLPPSERLAILPPSFDVAQTKWIIGNMDWFCGTRMHSTIAALSSRVPTAAIAYSDKTAGVFGSCGQAEHVSDPRILDVGEMIDKLWQSWLRREEAKQRLETAIPVILEQARLQMDEILSVSKKSPLRIALGEISNSTSR